LKIIDDIRGENRLNLSAEMYDRLHAVMHKLGYRDFLSREQGLITLKLLKGENALLKQLTIHYLNTNGEYKHPG
jgi:hypothetical protein